MDLEGKGCVVLASDAETIGDIKTSLSLLKMSVRGGTTVPAAKAELLNDPAPVIILVEEDLRGKTGAGRELAESLQGHPTLSGVPVCRLVTDLEGLAEEALFATAFKVPVEFPTFTREVKKFLLEGGAVSAPSDSAPSDSASAVAVSEVPSGQLTEEAQPEASAPVTPTEPEEVVPPFQESAVVASGISGEKRSEESSEKGAVGHRLLNRRLLVAYGIQLAVLDALERDSEFLSASLEELPGLVTQATERIAQEFDLSEVLERQQAG
ncbi:hypothetical protein MRY87_01730 [bacterium]|nr:hypothetical protein [bacterium]